MPQKNSPDLPPMEPAEATINTFLVDVFNDVLRLENESLRRSGCRQLSVSELHMLEAVQSGAAGMGELAERLSLSPGSVTIAAKTLEQKGYLVRRRSQTDRRRVTVCLTPRAEDALAYHAAFHRRLIGAVSAELSVQQMNALGDALRTLHTFFKGYAPGGIV